MTKPIYTFSTENLNIKYKARLRKRTSVVLLLHIFGKNCLPAVLTRWNDETDPPFTTFQGAVMMLLHEPQGFFQTAFWITLLCAKGPHSFPFMSRFHLNVNVSQNVWQNWTYEDVVVHSALDRCPHGEVTGTAGHQVDPRGKVKGERKGASSFQLTSSRWVASSGNNSLTKSSSDLGWMAREGAGLVRETPCCLVCSFWRRRSFLRSLAFRHGGRLGSAPLPAHR